MTLQPFFSTLSSPLLSGTWLTAIPNSSIVHLVVSSLPPLFSLCLAGWFWSDLTNRKCDHTIAMCASLSSLQTIVGSNCLLELYSCGPIICWSFTLVVQLPVGTWLVWFNCCCGWLLWSNILLDLDSCGPTACWILAWTSSVVTQSDNGSPRSLLFLPSTLLYPHHTKLVLTIFFCKGSNCANGVDIVQTSCGSRTLSLLNICWWSSRSEPVQKNVVRTSLVWMRY